jgi:multisubunit Na+/H+ antiporter MnhE subunit
MMRVVATVAALTGVYALMLASANPWDFGTGAVLGALIVLVFIRFLFPTPALPPGEVIRRAATAPALIAAAVANIVAGTLIVAKVVLSKEGPRHSGFVVIPQGDRTHAGVVVSSWLDTLSPGTVLVEIDDEARTWTIHALDASDPDGMRADLERFYQRFQRPVAP